MNGEIYKLYNYCHRSNCLDDMFKIIDFLLNDRKFENWSKNNKAKLSKIINNFFNTHYIKYEYRLSSDELLLSNNKIHIRIGNGSQCEMLFKGIRNGIVHLNFRVSKMTINKQKYDCIVIDDVSAKIRLPICYIKCLYNEYSNINIQL